MDTDRLTVEVVDRDTDKEGERVAEELGDPVAELVGDTVLEGESDTAPIAEEELVGDKLLDGDEEGDTDDTTHVQHRSAYAWICHDVLLYIVTETEDAFGFVVKGNKYILFLSDVVKLGV